MQRARDCIMLQVALQVIYQEGVHVNRPEVSDDDDDDADVFCLCV